MALGIGPAAATTIDVGPGLVSCYELGTTTSAACSGIVISGGTSFSSTQATITKIKPSNPGIEAAFLSDLLGLTGLSRYGASDVAKTDKGGANAATYDVLTRYFLVKLGAGHAYLRNDFGSAITVSYVKKSGGAGKKGGLSHESQIGGFSASTSPVPVPAGLPLLMAGLGGFAFLRSRRR